MIHYTPRSLCCQFVHSIMIALLRQMVDLQQNDHKILTNRSETQFSPLPEEIYQFATKL